VNKKIITMTDKCGKDELRCAQNASTAERSRKSRE
jgi:hypothetical protein